MKCPLCSDGEPPPSSTSAFEGLTVDVEEGSVSYQGKTRRLTQRQSHVLHKIVSAWPGFCRREKLFTIIRSLSSKEYVNELNNLAVHISRLRSTLQDVGLGIETRWGEGYQINTRPGMRAIGLWSKEEKLSMIEEHNKGRSWVDVATMFSTTTSVARGLAHYASRKYEVPLLRGRKFRATGAKSGVRRAASRNAQR